MFLRGKLIIPLLFTTYLIIPFPPNPDPVSRMGIFMIYCLIFTCIPTFLHTYLQTNLHTYLHTYLPAYLPAYLPTYISTYASYFAYWGEASTPQEHECGVFSPPSNFKTNLSLSESDSFEFRLKICYFTGEEKCRNGNYATRTR